MRIVIDTGDLRNLGRVARRCAERLNTIDEDIRRANSSTQLNTRDDSQLRRHRPHDGLRDIQRNLQGLEDGYRRKARHYEARARRVEGAERLPWRPFPILVPQGPFWGGPIGVLPPIVAGGVGDALRPPTRALPIGLLATRPRVPIVAPRSPSLLERGIGLLSRGVEALRRGFQDVTSRIVDTVRGAWSRIWNRTSSLLRSVLDGLQGIAVTGVQIAVGGYSAVTTTVGRWTTSAIGAGWSFLGQTWDLLNQLGDYAFTLLDLTELVGLLSIPALVGWIDTAVGAVDTVVQFARYGLGDARFWTALVDTVGGTLAGMAGGPYGVLTGLAWTASFWFGGQLSEWLVMPFLDRRFDNLDAQRDRAADRDVNELALDARNGDVEGLRDLVLSDPARWGNDDRIPPALRIEANEIALREYYSQLFEQPRSPEIQAETLRLETWIRQGRRFLVFDPDNGLIAELMGANLETASSVSIVVPGIGNSVENFDGGPRRDAKDLLAGLRANGEQNGAVIAWLGYDAPPRVVEGLGADDLAVAVVLGGPAALARFIADNGQAQIVGSENAEEGGRRLKGLVESLNEFTRPEARLTIFGHSYGSRVVGEAAKLGLNDVDDIVFLGSPGIGVDDVSEFNLESKTELHAFQDSDDLVASAPSQIHGPNPATLDGVEDHATPGVEGHSGYYEELSGEFARIVIGVDDLEERLGTF